MSIVDKYRERARSRLISDESNESPLTNRDVSKLLTPTGNKIGINAVPLLSYNWYVLDLLEDRYKPEMDSNLERIGVKPVKVFREGTPQKKLFPVNFQFIPEGEVPLEGEESFSSGGLVQRAIFNFPFADLFSAQFASLVSEEGAPADSPQEGGQIIAPRPSPPGGKEIPLVKNFLEPEDDSVELGKQKEEFAPFFLLKKRLLGDQKFPIPGELFGLAVRAFPNHPWFNQETNPYLFAGDFFETGEYSGGVIEDFEVLLPSGLPPDRSYSVRVKGKLEVGVRSSDYKEYNIGDRVALFKGSERTEGVFTEKDLKEYSSNWVIVPVEFYKE